MGPHGPMRAPLAHGAPWANGPIASDGFLVDATYIWSYVHMLVLSYLAPRGVNSYIWQDLYMGGRHVAAVESCKFKWCIAGLFVLAYVGTLFYHMWQSRSFLRASSLDVRSD
jgi:hypothetical protein